MSLPNEGATKLKVPETQSHTRRSFSISLEEGSIEPCSAASLTGFHRQNLPSGFTWTKIFELAHPFEILIKCFLCSRESASLKIPNVLLYMSALHPSEELTGSGFGSLTVPISNGQCPMSRPTGAAPDSMPRIVCVDRLPEGSLNIEIFTYKTL